MHVDGDCQNHEDDYGVYWCVYSFFTSSQRGPLSGITKMEALIPAKLNMRCVCMSLCETKSPPPPPRPVYISSLSLTCWSRFLFFQGKKAELKSFITELSKEFSILSQFTSFVAIEERVCAIFRLLYIYMCIHFWKLLSTTPHPPPRNQVTLHPGFEGFVTSCFVAPNLNKLPYPVLGLRTNRGGLHRHPQVDHRGRCWLPPLHQLEASSGL